MLVGHNPSWATASGGPMDTTENKPLKTPKQLEDFKQYAKDVFQFMKDNEANGLTWQREIAPVMYENNNMAFSIADARANDTWFAVVKEADAKPGFFAQIAPEDSDAAGATQTYVWGDAEGADSYTLTVSENKDLSNPIIVKEGITGTSYQSDTELTVGKRYYWSVKAVNAFGSRNVSHDVKYSFIVCDSADVPGQFGPYMPSVGARNEDIHTELKWSVAYDADSYHVEESANAFFYELKVYEGDNSENPVIHRTNMIYNKYTVEQGALEPGKTYTWEVTAHTKDKSISTDCSNISRTFTVKETPCSPLLYSEVPGDNEVTLYFRSSIGADSYNIYYGKEPGIYTRKITGVTGTDYTVTGLKAGQDYYFGISAVNEHGESDIWNIRDEAPTGSNDNWTEDSEEGTYIAPPAKPTPDPQVTPSPGNKGDVNNKDNPANAALNKPAKVKIKSAVSKKKKTIIVKWKKVKANEYQIKIGLNKKLTKGKKTYIVNKAKTVKKVIRKLKSGKRYYVKVRAFNKNETAVRYGKWSKAKVVKVK